jgi:hypothetical protein
MTDAVRAYEQLYAITLKMARDYQASSDGVWKAEVLNACSNGQQSYDPYDNTLIHGNLYKLCVDDPENVNGSLSSALYAINDYNDIPGKGVPGAQSIWGIEQVNNLQALCSIFAFNYIGPQKP